jgi:hypothetical protein
MRHRLIAAVLMVGTLLGGGLRASPHDDQADVVRGGHIAWVAEVLKRMETIKPGMTRKQLLVVFATEGGLSSALRRTFVSRDCPYFKVDVEFEAVGRPSHDKDGRATAVERDEDRIVTISRPYLASGTID